MRALIVDDSRFVRTFLRGLLEGKGIVCEEAGDGQAALDLLHAGPAFDVAFVDWYMPEMNGLDLLKRLRQEAFGTLKVVMVSTESESDRMLRALEAGADEYLMKPFDEEALTEKLFLVGIEVA